MEHSVYENKLSKLSARFNLMVFMVFFLLVSNALLAGLCWYTSIHQKIEITPFSGSNGYLKSESEVDGHYLNLMSENFIYSRFNVTPETVDANYNRLLNFVDSKNYAPMLKTLQKEARIIKDKKMSGVFNITEINSNPKHLSTDVSGILNQRVGLRALKDEKVTYRIQYRYNLGRLSISRFTRVEGDNNE